MPCRCRRLYAPARRARARIQARPSPRTRRAGGRARPAAGARGARRGRRRPAARSASARGAAGRRRRRRQRGAKPQWRRGEAAAAAATWHWQGERRQRCSVGERQPGSVAAQQQRTPHRGLKDALVGPLGPLGPAPRAPVRRATALAALGCSDVRRYNAVPRLPHGPRTASARAMAAPLLSYSILHPLRSVTVNAEPLAALGSKAPLVSVAVLE